MLQVLDYYLKLNSYNAMMQLQTSATDIVYHKCDIIVLTQISASTIHFMREYIGIRLNGYGGK